MASIGEAFVTLRADLSKFGEDIAKGMEGNLNKLGVVAGAAATAVGVAALKIGSVWDDATDNIAIATGKTGDDLAGLQRSFEDVFTSVPVSAGQASAAVAELSKRLHETGEPLEAMATSFLNLSRLTGTDIRQNIADLTRVFGDWSIASEDQAGALDKVFKASQTTGAGIGQLSQQVVQFGAPMRQLGFSFDETLAILGKFEAEGVNTELVMGSMRVALGRMARAGEEPVETLGRVIQSIKDAGSAGEANAIALEIFGARAGPDMAAAIREGRFEIDDLVKTIENSGGAIDQAVKDTDGWREQFTLLKNNVIDFVAPYSDIIGITATVGGGFLALAAQTGQAVPAFKGLLAAVQGIGPAFTAANAAMATSGPLFLGLAVAAAAVTAAYIIMGDSSDKIAGQVSQLTDKEQKLKEVNELITEASGIRKSRLEDLRDELEKQIATEKETEAAIVKQKVATEDAARASGDFTQLVKDLNTTLDGMTSAADSAFGALDKFKNVPTQEQLDLRAAIANTNAELATHEQRLNNAKAAGDDVTASMESGIIKSLEAEKQRLDDSNRVLETNRDRAVAMGDAKLGASGKVDGLTGSEGELIGRIDAATGALSGQTGTAWGLVGALDAVTAAANQAYQASLLVAQTASAALPTNAEGTDFWRGGMTWVGERGPEIVSLPRGSRIHSNADSMAMVRGGGDGGSAPQFQVTVNIDGRPYIGDMVQVAINETNAQMRRAAQLHGFA